MNRPFENCELPDLVSLNHRSAGTTERSRKILVTPCMAALREHSKTMHPAIHLSQRVGTSFKPLDLDFSVQHRLRCSKEHVIGNLTEKKRAVSICTGHSLSSDESLSSQQLSTFPISRVIPPCVQSSRQHCPESSELEDLPLMFKFDELPVAEDLIKHIDLFFQTTEKSTKEVSEDEEDEEEKIDDSLNSSPDDGTRSYAVMDEQWTERFQELCDFKKEKGHCNVPHNFNENPALARWVKRQRHQFKLLKIDADDNRHVSKTVIERVQALRDLGFIFHYQRTAWDEKFAELCEYRKKHKNCNVPSNYPQNQSLAMWVKCQRRQYKMLLDGRRSAMTEVRLQQLRDVDFTWELRNYNKRPRLN